MTMTSAQYLAMQAAAKNGRGKFAFDAGWNGQTLRFATGDDAISIGGETFTPRLIDIPKIRIGTDDEVSFSFAVANYAPGDALKLSQRHLQSRFSGETMTWYFGIIEESGWREIYQYAWDIANGRIDPYSPMFEFQLRSSTGSRPRAGQPRWGRSCNLIFKGAVCGYSGAETWCDGSLARCSTLGRLESNRSLVLAPEPDYQIKMWNSANSSISVPGGFPYPPPPPGGQTDPIDGGNWRIGNGGRLAPGPIMQTAAASQADVMEAMIAGSSPRTPILRTP